MAKKKETLFSEKVAKDLKELGEKVWFEKIQQVAIRGTPDYLLCVSGRFVALELKRDEDIDPDPLQQYKLSRIKYAGGVALKVTPTTWGQVLNVIKAILEVQDKVI